MHKAVPLRGSGAKLSITYNGIGLCNPDVAAPARRGSNPTSGLMAVKQASPHMWTRFVLSAPDFELAWICLMLQQLAVIVRSQAEHVTQYIS